MEKRPQVGIGVIIKRQDKILLGKRKNSHGDGTWSFPGGHLEYGETRDKCAAREVSEETGLTIKNIRFASVTNDIFEDDKKHYITLFVTADCNEGEPEKCGGWEGFPWEDLPRQLFLPVKNLIKTGFHPGAL